MIHEDGEVLQAFSAILAGSPADAFARLTARHPGAGAEDMALHNGFDASAPFLNALISPALVDIPR